MIKKQFIDEDSGDTRTIWQVDGPVVKAEQVASPLDLLVSLQAVRACIEYILCEVQNNPDDCLHCIANEAFLAQKLPLFVSKVVHDGGPYYVSVDKKSKFFAG